MSLKAIWKTLWHSPIGPLLLSAQAALSLMIFANVAFVIDARLEATERSTGMDLANVFWIESDGQGKDYDQQSAVKFDLEYLNLLPGVASASVNSGLPQTRDGLRSLISLDPDLKTNKRFAFVYQTNEKIVDVLGLHLIAGRMFSPDTVLPVPPRDQSKHRAFGSEVVITESLAIKLFGSSERALAKPAYFSLLDGASATIVGVVKLLQSGPPYGPGTDFVYDVVLAPAIPQGSQASYLVRTKPGMLDSVMARVRKEFAPLQQHRTIYGIDTLAAIAAQVRSADRTDAIILAVLCSLVLTVTMLGLFGFASFAVSSRTKEIGTRRAIGATRADIVKLFLLENWLITTAGIIVGSVITLAFSLQLRFLLELPRLPLVFLVGCMVLLWAGGLLAALFPALRGGAVPPAVATRVV
jgi:putative ABC transport system permease protein